MPAVNPPSPASAPHPDAAQAVQLLEMELARARARRLAREHGAGGSRRALRALCVLFLLALMAAGFYAFWRAQEMRGEVRRIGPGAGAASVPAKRP